MSNTNDEFISINEFVPDTNCCISYSDPNNEPPLVDPNDYEKLKQLQQYQKELVLAFKETHGDLTKIVGEAVQEDLNKIKEVSQQCLQLETIIDETTKLHNFFKCVQILKNTNYANKKALDIRQIPEYRNGNFMLDASSAEKYCKIDLHCHFLLFYNA